jgi:hypothetical protein
MGSRRRRSAVTHPWSVPATKDDGPGKKCDEQVCHVQLQTLPPRFRHTWTRDRGGGLTSTCMRCLSVIATDTDEMSLLALEQKHTCTQAPQK